MDETLSAAGSALDDLARHILALDFPEPVRAATEKHLVLALVNLYAAWLDDPAMSVGVSLSNSGYKARSKYNPLAISNQLISVVSGLAGAGYVHGVPGFNDPRTHVGRTTRIWASAKLEGLFEQARERGVEIGRAAGTEVIVLRDAARKGIEYDDTPMTNDMRSKLLAYNSLLAKVFIDIPELEDPVINLPGGKRFRIRQSDKLVRRVFNRSSWEKGGRFYGGWWQGCPKAWRSKICIDDQPTIEDDYSGLHIMMLYAREGIDYWRDVPDSDDPYRIDFQLEYLENPSEQRAYAKQLLLMAVNADSDAKAFQAFRSECAHDGDVKGQRMKNVQLAVLLDALRKKHAPIAHLIGAGLGIDLMNQDAQITSEIINHFVGIGRPILSIHDSYIVQIGDDERLREVLASAFEKITGISTSKLKRVGVGFGEALTDENKLRLANDSVNRVRTSEYTERRAAFMST